MPELKRNPHEPYIDAVLAAMPADVAPAWCWVDDTETGDDGETMVLTAVLTWTGEANPRLWPHGLLLLWSHEHGWRYAGLRPDGSNDWPTETDLPLWAAPADVAALAAALLDEDQPIPAATNPEWCDAAVMTSVREWIDA